MSRKTERPEHFRRGSALPKHWPKKQLCRLGLHKWIKTGEGLGNTITNFITDYKCEREGCNATKRESLFENGLPY